MAFNGHTLLLPQRTLTHLFTLLNAHTLSLLRMSVVLVLCSPMTLCSFPCEFQSRSPHLKIVRLRPIVVTCASGVPYVNALDV